MAQPNARDLGYLLGKHPDRTQTFELSHGVAHVCFPEASDDRCTAALILEVDAVGLVRRDDADEGFALGQYTNDRPYVASSLLSVAISRVFGRALGGRCAERPELAASRIPLEARISVVRAKGGERMLRALFEPLGYTLERTAIAFDERFPAWGESPYHEVVLRGCVRLEELLRHLTVLLPVLDDEKHYWVGDAEVEKLLDRGEGWLATHPEREQIAHRYLKHRPSLTRAAMQRLADDDGDDDDAREEVAAAGEDALERTITLAEQRRRAVLEHIVAKDAHSVIDLGCGEGQLLRRLMRMRGLERVVGVDVSARVLEIAARRTRLDELSPRQRERIAILQGSLTLRDARFAGFDVACLVEVIEHLDPSRLGALERVVWQYARPQHVLVTTPNAEYNVRFASLPAGKFRHRDHRFEWTRAEFRAWAEAVAARHGYIVELGGVGPHDDEVGAATQIGAFSR